MLGQAIEGQDFWDFCCDHGLLGKAALRSGRFAQVYLVDRVPHIIQKLRAEPNLGTANTILSAAEDVVIPIRGSATIAGVGGHNIIKILRRWEQGGNLQVARLILNPLTHINELREFLAEWKSYSESTTLFVRESERDRQIIVLTGRLPSQLRT